MLGPSTEIFSPSDLFWGTFDIVEPDGVAPPPEPDLAPPADSAIEATTPLEAAVADPAGPEASEGNVASDGDMVPDFSGALDAFDYDAFAASVALDFSSLLFGMVTTEGYVFG